MSAGAWVDGEFGKTREFAKRLLQVVVHLEGALASVVGLQRVQILELRHHCHFLVDDGVILHCARAKWVETVVHAEVVGRVIGVVTHHGHLVAFGQFGIVGAAHFGRHLVMRETVVGQRVATSAGMAQFEYQISV